MWIVWLFVKLMFEESRFIWQGNNGKIDGTKTRGSMGWAWVVHLSFCFVETTKLHRCFLPNFCSFGYSVSEKIFLEIDKSETRIACSGLWMDRDKMCNLYREPSIDASHQVSVHLAKGFQRRRLKCEKLTDDRRRTPSDGKSSHSNNKDSQM